jgi:hypothetical protein
MPATQLHFAQLGMVKLIPINIALAVKHLIVPLHDGNVIFYWMFAEPINKFVILDTRLLLYAPNLCVSLEDV